VTTPSAEIAAAIARHALGWPSASVHRFPTGSGHYVFAVTSHEGEQAVIRMGQSDRSDGLNAGLALMERLGAAGVPLPRIFGHGTERDLPWVAMERLPGTDLGHVVHDLGDSQLRAVAEAVARAQRITATTGTAGRYGYAATPETAPFTHWSQVVEQNLARSRRRMAEAGLFDTAIIAPVEAALAAARPALDALPATPFLHDTTTKNVIVTPAGTFSGIVDVDDLCFGDPRWAPALTRAALLAHDGPVHYVDHWMAAADEQADTLFALYIVVFLLDLMSEHGQVFNGNEKPSSREARERLQARLEAELHAPALAALRVEA